MTIQEKYQRVISLVLDEFSKEPVLAVANLLTCSSLKSVNEEILETVIDFLVLKKILKYTKPPTGTKKDILQVLPNLQEIVLPESPQHEMKIESICLSFPQFDFFGLKERFGVLGIPYRPLNKTVDELFAGTKQILRICSPFFELKGTNILQNTLIECAKSGVQIKILTRGEFKKRNPRQWANFLRKLGGEENENLIDVRDYHYTGDRNRVNSSIHAKLIIQDLNCAYIGSGELRENSFQRNFELGVLVIGTGVKYLAQIFDEIFAKGREIALE